MPLEDAQRWNTRYQEEERYSSFQKPRLFLLEIVDNLPDHGLALDVAMGLGGNASYLLERGLRVVGVDISGVAVRKAKRAFPQLMAVQADLTEFYLHSKSFDVILNFFYLQRDLWPDYVRALRPGGWLVFETLTREMRRINPEIDPDYLLGPGELRRGFPQLEIIEYREAWTESDTGHPRPVASLLAHKPLE